MENIEGEIQRLLGSWRQLILDGMKFEDKIL